MSAALLVLLAMAPKKNAAPSEPPALWPMAAPADIVGRFRETAALAKAKGAAAELACRLVAESLSLCFVKGDGSELDYVTQADLGAWGLDLAAVEALARANARAGIEAGRPARTPVEGMSGVYWLSAEADGRDAAGLLFPDLLAGIAGSPVVVGVPAQGALLFWVPGDRELDQVMAVGVRRIHDSSAQPVSSKIYRWDGDHWVVWGEAVPEGAAEPLERR